MEKNVTYFPTAAAAAEAGYRPCLRCRPESSPGTPAWMGTSTTVNRALRLIGEGALDEASIDVLSERLGITPRHLSRLFSRHLGASPKAVAQTRRLLFAKKLLDETDLSMTEVALSAGYKSVRRFNDHFRQTYAKTPGALRTSRQPGPQQDVDDGCADFELKLGYRPPFDFDGVLGFLKVRATPGIELVGPDFYSRTIQLGDTIGYIRVSHKPEQHILLVQIKIDEPRHLFAITERIKRIFDLEADPSEINGVLKKDKHLKLLATQNPGQRLPGSWSPFEVAVRAIVGQQVSVKGATTVMGRIAAAYGRQTDQGLCFPTPEMLASLDVQKMSMPRARAQAIADMSRAVADGAIVFDATTPTADLVEQLKTIKGIGEWTADYIAMRALNDPDAFLHGDLVLLKVAKHLFDLDSSKALLALSANWRPWRAYAGMHLWRQAAKLDSINNGK